MRNPLHQPDMQVRRVKRKALLLGDGAVGKTSLVRKYVMDRFDDKYITTIGTKVTKKVLEFRSGSELVEITMMLWDVLGQKGYTGIQRSSYKGAEGIIFVCDATRPETLKSLKEYWIPEAVSVVGSVPFVFAVNKSDLERSISEEDVKALADGYGAPYFFTSAKTGDNVEEMFRALGKAMTAEAAPRPSGIPASPSGTAPETGNWLVKATDAIIQDFCAQYGDYDLGMAIVRRKSEEAGLDVKAPTEQALRKLVLLLYDAEADVKGEEVARQNRTRRKLMIKRPE